MAGPSTRLRLGSLGGLVVLFALLIGLGAPAGDAVPAVPAATPDTRIPGHYIVFLDDSIERPGDIARSQVARFGGKLGFVYNRAFNGYSAELSAEAVDEMRNDPRVKFITPDHHVELNQLTPTGVKRTFASSNGSIAINEEEDVVVDADIAILDTGVDSEHADLDVVHLTDCSGGGKCVENQGKDALGHGTHVAGIAGAVDNGIGMVGEAPGARLWGVKVFNDKEESSGAIIAAGVEWVIAHAKEIEVANMSLGCHCSMPGVELAIKVAVEKGIVVVVAAGNDALDAEEFSPAKNSNAVTVSALADFDGKPGKKGEKAECELEYEEELGKEVDDTFANFSNYGEVVDVIAPGVCIYSTLPTATGEYGFETGTSMATPYVSGAAAILTTFMGTENAEDVEKIRGMIEEKGNAEWEDEHEGVQEPLLDLSDEEVFDP